MNFGGFQSISITRSSGAFHPLLRSALFFLAYQILTLVVALATLAMPFSGSSLAMYTLAAALSFAVVLALVYLFRRFLDQRSLSSLGLGRRKALKLTGRGILIGLALISITVLPQLLLGTLTPSDNLPPLTARLVWGMEILPLLVLAAMTEELAIRGYLLQNLSAGSTVPLGVLASSTIFAMLHLANPDIGAIAILNMVLAGIFFSLYYLVEGTLWGPFGAHLAWNFTQGYIFGLPVSGIALFEREPLINLASNGPYWLTGGLFGPEGGVAVTLTFLTGSLALLWLMYRSVRPADDQAIGKP